MMTEEQKINYLTTQIENVYLKDIIDRYHLQSNNAIGKLLDVIASGISTTMSFVFVDLRWMSVLLYPERKTGKARI
jgi:predicted AAA+ superfamily ATPase